MLVSATSALSLPVRSDPPAKTILPPTSLPFISAQKLSVTQDFGRLPLSFERNQGQTNAKVRFLTRSADSTLFLTPTEAVFAMPSQPQRRKKNVRLQGRKSDRQLGQITRVALRMQMVGADPKASVLQQQPMLGRVNYFMGKDPGRWHAGIPTFGRVGFHNVYPGVDLVYYGNQRHLEYDFVVAPHADPKQIALHFAGAQSVHIDAAGNLLIRTQGRELKWQKPTVYQQGPAGNHPVAAHFQRTRMSNGQAGIRFALGHYNVDRPLVIDPVLLYSTYLGGNSNGANASGIATDSGGNAYITGLTYSVDFPTTPGAFQTVNSTGGRGGWVAFVSKLNAAGTALLYSTYLGGTSGRDSTSGIAVDAGGNAYVTGSAASFDFPTTPGVFQPANHTKVLNNAFVTKLNPTGTALVYSTYLGGTSIDQAYAIAIDSSGSAYVTGAAYSHDFPTTPGVVQPTTKAFQNMFPGNAFVTKLNPTGTALAYSTYLGGSKGGDTGAGIAVDNNGNAFVTGITFSSDFPTTPTAFQATYPAGIYSPTSFVTKLNSTGTDLVYSTYLGGSTAAGDEAKGIAIDNSGNAYVVGQVYSSDFPTTPGAFQRANNSPAGFVTKLNFTGTALLYSTYLGGSSGYGGDFATAIAVDSSGDAYVVGNAVNPDFPTTPGAFQRVNGSRSPQSAGTATSNAFVTKLSPTGGTLLYSTFLGGSNGLGAAAM
ncbi:MAG: Cell surface protein, partial [Chthonomonadaceae bacterium]|nr:Cell surface protein [Chthonomonadaceae bacterium]